ncbi:MAG: membrane dipeptidase [Armatimonadetes bacterium]|nr:membrane dipeptidase [Armatimonadota bacterium]
MIEVGERARELLRSCIVIDGLGGALINPTPHLVNGKEYVDLVRESGVTALSVTLVSEPGCNSEMRETLHGFYFNYRLIETSPDRLLLVTHADDIVEAKRTGRVGVILNLQSTWVLGMDRTLVSILHRLGLRVLQLTYMERNHVGSGCLEPVDLGLTSFGKQVVREMNRVGMLVDLSHAGVKTSLDAIETSEHPCAFTHANARALTDHPRNLTDEQVRACAARGGVIGLNSYASYVESTPGQHPTIEDFLNHVQYAVELAGIDHVGLGTDFFEGKLPATFLTNTVYPEFRTKYNVTARRAHGFSRIDELPNVVQGLLNRGFTPEQVRKFLGENFLRLFRQAWKR